MKVIAVKHVPPQASLLATRCERIEVTVAELISMKDTTGPEKTVEWLLKLTTRLSTDGEVVIRG